MANSARDYPEDDIPIGDTFSWIYFLNTSDYLHRRSMSKCLDAVQVSVASLPSWGLQRQPQCSSFPSRSATVQYRMFFIDLHFIYYIVIISLISHNVTNNYKSWRRIIHFGTIASECFKMVVKFWAPTFLKWNLRPNISKSHHLPRASQLPCLCQFFQDIGSLCPNLGFRSKRGREIHRNLEIHPGDTYPSKATICFLLLAVHLSLQNCWIHLEREITRDQKKGIQKL